MLLTTASPQGRTGCFGTSVLGSSHVVHLYKQSMCQTHTASCRLMFSLSLSKAIRLTWNIVFTVTNHPAVFMAALITTMTRKPICRWWLKSTMSTMIKCQSTTQNKMFLSASLWVLFCVSLCLQLSTRFLYWFYQCKKLVTEVWDLSDDKLWYSCNSAGRQHSKYDSLHQSKWLSSFDRNPQV